MLGCSVFDWSSKKVETVPEKHKSKVEECAIITVPKAFRRDLYSNCNKESMCVTMPSVWYSAYMLCLQSYEASTWGRLSTGPRGGAGSRTARSSCTGSTGSSCPRRRGTGGPPSRRGGSRGSRCPTWSCSRARGCARGTCSRGCPPEDTCSTILLAVLGKPSKKIAIFMVFFKNGLTPPPLPPTFGTFESLFPKFFNKKFQK